MKTDKMADAARDVAAKAGKDAGDALEYVKEQLEITDNGSLRFAVGVAAEIKESRAMADDKRRSWVDPLLSVVKDINATFKPVLESLDKTEGLIKAKISNFRTGQARRRTELIAEATDESIEQAETYIVEPVPGLSYTEAWGGEVEDAVAIIRWCIDNDRLELLTPDVKALKALTKAKAADPKVDGWCVVHKTTEIITVAKVHR